LNHAIIRSRKFDCRFCERRSKKPETVAAQGFCGASFLSTRDMIS
jgi:hypothetical protein